MRIVKRKLPLYATIALVAVVFSSLFALYSNNTERFSRGSGGCVAIVEPRKHPRFKETLDLFLERVPGDWSLYVFCGTDNETFARDAAKSWFERGRTVEIANLGVSNLNADLYNKLFKTKTFWQRFREETILVVQTDAVPCASSSIDIDYFVDKGFGYIGCAYGNKVGKNTYWEDHSFYGVGGLSLRRKSFALKVCDAFPPGTSPDAEDVAFSDGVDLFSSEYPVPEAGDLLDFCAQNASRPGRSWGAHQIAKQLPNSEKKPFYEYCPASRGI